ncbi:hypothetical protein BCV70DRAFT_13451 [Testicularia cyperi]|uniref:Uncharacterized protein n=1 Tax=Testicularia cyperi TaxID=1882483 RepID=A0A317XY55_9BASI|nr:hypothetical protein BCV70DRAFT_13451 [Testicularia cyperi]
MPFAHRIFDIFEIVAFAVSLSLQVVDRGQFSRFRSQPILHQASPAHASPLPYYSTALQYYSATLHTRDLAELGTLGLTASFSGRGQRALSLPDPRPFLFREDLFRSVGTVGGAAVADRCRLGKYGERLDHARYP